MIHVPTATRSELEIEILNNDDLMKFLGGEAAVLATSTDELRDKITEWIIEGDETSHI